MKLTVALRALVACSVENPMDMSIISPSGFASNLALGPEDAPPPDCGGSKGVAKSEDQMAD